MPDKVSPRLQEQLKRAKQDERVEVEVHFESPPSDAKSVPRDKRAEEMARRQRDFAAQVARAREALGQAACDPDDMAWINRTCRMRLDAGAVARLKRLDDVESMDVPTKLERE